ncbi:hypothetical protein [Kitasatospora sp. NPDC058478]|uniref:hypothetical protein n=1 Tax=unclassified Kitasatospora TaxID=2633591 RepID=UPI0036659212
MDGGGHVFGLSPDRSVVYQWQGGTNWTQIGGPAGSIVAGGNTLIATDPTSGDVFRYGGAPNSWSRIGGPGAQFAVDDAGGVYGLTPDRGGVFQWQGGANWAQVGGPAGSIVAGGGRTLLATDPTSGDVFRYGGAPNSWSRIGGPGAEFSIDGAGTVYGLSPDRGGVFKWLGGANWAQVGGPAAWLAAS